MNIEESLGLACVDCHFKTTPEELMDLVKNSPSLVAHHLVLLLNLEGTIENKLDSIFFNRNNEERFNEPVADPYLNDPKLIKKYFKHTYGQDIASNPQFFPILNKILTQMIYEDEENEYIDVNFINSKDAICNYIKVYQIGAHCSLAQLLNCQILQDLMIMI